MSTYEEALTTAKAYLTSQGYSGSNRGDSGADQARASRGIGFAILALAEALRPEPTRVTLTVNTDEVKAAVVDALEGQR